MSICIMILYKNTKAMVHSSNGNTDFFDIISGAVQGDTLAPYLLTIYLDYILWKLIEIIKVNGLTLKKREEADNIPQKLSWMQTI